MCDSSTYIFAGPSALRVRGLRRPDELSANPPPLSSHCCVSFPSDWCSVCGCPCVGVVMCFWLVFCYTCRLSSTWRTATRSSRATSRTCPFLPHGQESQPHPLPSALHRPSAFAAQSSAAAPVAHPRVSIWPQVAPPSRGLHSCSQAVPPSSASAPAHSGSRKARADPWWRNPPWKPQVSKVRSH